jgi:hypothetical protein
VGLDQLERETLRDRVEGVARLLRRGDTREFPAAIDELGRCLALLPEGDEDRGRVADLLGWAETTLCNSRPRTLADSRRLARVLDGLRADFEGNAPAILTLGDVHQWLWEETAELSEAIAARRAFKDGLALLDGEDPRRRTVSRAVGDLGMQIDSLLRDKQDRIRVAGETVEHYEIALRSAQDAADRAEARYALATALRLRDYLTPDEADLRRALELLDEAGRDAGDELAALIPNARGLCLKNLDRIHGQDGALGAEIEAFEDAWRLRHAGDALHRDVVLPGNLANALAARARRDEDAGDVTRALQLYRVSAENAARSSLPRLEMMAGNWIAFAAEQKAWSEVVDAGELALTTLRRFGEQQRAFESRASAVFGKRAFAGHLVEAYLALDRPDAALVAAERVRGWLLKEPDDAEEAGVVAEASRLVPLCYLVELAGNRIVALTAVPGEPVPRIVEIRVDPEELVARLAEFWWAVTNCPATVSPSALSEVVERAGNWLWTIVGPIVAAHEDLEALAVIASGRLALVPLQAAWTEDEDEPSGRRYAIDALVLSFPLSARRLIHDTGRPTGSDGPALVASHPGHESVLQWVEREREVVQAAFPAGRTTDLPAARRDELLRDAATHDVLHLACHAVANVRQPLLSSLALADGDVTVADFGDLRLSARLAFLSACTTGAVAFELPEEAIGLGGMFSQLGCTAVIASSWPVPDAAAAMLVAHFYELWREDGLPPAAALRAAQARVRDCTGPVGALTRRTLGVIPDLGDPPLPAFYWAAFTLSGR